MAKCAATSDDEHAVSSVKHGPVSPSVYEIRPDATERAPEVPEYTESGFISPAPSPGNAPPAPRKKPTGIFRSNARELEAQSVQVVLSRTRFIWRFIPCDSIFEIPKAGASDRNTVKDPYAAGAYERSSLFFQRETGTIKFVARAQITTFLSPDFIDRLPDRTKENESESMTELDATGSSTGQCIVS
ncbi:hypothetical protein N9O24_00335 [bacterium]|nr:hypothetical protein [bacterium]